MMSEPLEFGLDIPKTGAYHVRLSSSGRGAVVTATKKAIEDLVDELEVPVDIERYLLQVWPDIS